MENFLYYLLKVVICSAMFVACYWLLLKNSRLHRWNRFYILAAVVLSITIPLMKISLVFNELNDVPLYAQQFIVDQPAEMKITGVMEEHTSSFSWEWMLYTFCSLGCFLLLVKEVKSLIRIVRLKHCAEKVSVRGIDLYCTDDGQTPFTFFRTIFWNKDISPDTEEGRCVLTHELAHVRLLHSWDKAFIRLVCCIFWMNPFFRFFCRELELVHEFAADSETIGEGDGKALSSLILCTLYPNHYHDFTSRFFQSPIKRRIAMITNQKKISSGIIRKISIIPVILVALYLFSLRVIASGPENAIIVQDDKDPLKPQNALEELVTIVAFGNTSKPVEEPAPVSFSRKNPKSGVFTYNEVEVKPTYNGKAAGEGFREYMARNLTYPPTAIEVGQKGKVIVSFIVDENGKVTDAEAVVNPYPTLGKEVERAVKASSAWTPGKKNGKNVPVQCYAFVEFKLNGGQITKTSESADDEYLYAKVDQKPLFEGRNADESFREFINKNTIYPPDALKNNNGGRVYVEFVIDKNGDVKNAKVVRDPGKSLSEEALRVVNSSPRWTPGKMNGKNVNVRYAFPIVFKLQGDKKSDSSETSKL
ncbi:MAG: M56 family metallopeptidase [Bacteroidales bacterium]|jgi:TonB family protein|nr:M56 family metallopeptidase [Bacteroidales bacterium]